VLTRYPQSAKAPDAMLAIAAIQSDQGDSGSARNTLEDIIARYPLSEAAGKARARLAALRR
jgi:TolA-binding protein